LRRHDPFSLNGPIGVAKIADPSRRSVGVAAQTPVRFSIRSNNRVTEEVASRFRTFWLIGAEKGQFARLAVGIHQEDNGQLFTVD
jgi:hypothetical protein